MIKRLNILPWLLTMLLMVACVGEDSVVEKDNTDEREISFSNNLASGETVTRAGEGLENYVQSFRVYGYKTKSNGVQEVFPGYTVSYTANSANTTASNTSDWEYVNDTQMIKYWDYGATYYSFSAVAGTPATSATYTCNDAKTEASYKDISLTSDNLTAKNAFYFSQPCQIHPANYAKVVTPQFTPYLCKVRFAFYETMEGFSVKNLTFGDETYPTHLIAKSKYTDAGTCSLTYDYANNTLATSITTTASSTTKDFGEVQYSSNDLLGTASNNASFTLGDGAGNDYFVAMLPNENNDTPITITCSYKAVQSNGIATAIRNIPAVVPAEFAKWKPGFEYTYIFKISATEEGIALVDVNQVAIKNWGTTEATEHSVYNW